MNKILSWMTSLFGEETMNDDILRVDASGLVPSHIDDASGVVVANDASGPSEADVGDASGTSADAGATTVSVADTAADSDTTSVSTTDALLAKVKAILVTLGHDVEAVFDDAVALAKKVL